MFSLLKVLSDGSADFGSKLDMNFLLQNCRMLFFDACMVFFVQFLCLNIRILWSKKWKCLVISLLQSRFLFVWAVGYVRIAFKIHQKFEPNIQEPSRSNKRCFSVFVDLLRGMELELWFSYVMILFPSVSKLVNKTCEQNPTRICFLLVVYFLSFVSHVKSFCTRRIADSYHDVFACWNV